MHARAREGAGSDGHERRSEWLALCRIIFALSATPSAWRIACQGARSSSTPCGTSLRAKSSATPTLTRANPDPSASGCSGPDSISLAGPPPSIATRPTPRSFRAPRHRPTDPPRALHFRCALFFFCRSCARCAVPLRKCKADRLLVASAADAGGTVPATAATEGETSRHLKQGPVI